MPTFQVGQFVVTQASVSIYDEPSTKASKIAQHNGAQLLVEEQVRDPEGSVWWRVRTSTGSTGFVLDSTQGHFAPTTADLDGSADGSPASTDRAPATQVRIPGWVLGLALILLIQFVTRTIDRGLSEDDVAEVSFLAIGAWACWAYVDRKVPNPTDRLASLSAWFWFAGVVTALVVILGLLGIDPLGIGSPNSIIVLAAVTLLVCALVLTTCRRFPPVVLVAVLVGGSLWAYDTVSLIKAAVRMRGAFPPALYGSIVVHVIVLASVVGGLRAALTLVLDRVSDTQISTKRENVCTYQTA